jgi:hypothetical protein
MADLDAPLRGILEITTAAAIDDETTGYHLNHVTIEVDTSEIGALDENLEGLPVSVEGRFEMREHPESGTCWILRAHSMRGDVPGRGDPLSGYPPSAWRSSTEEDEMDPGEQITDTRDERYNLVSVLYHAPHGAETIEA